MLQLKDIFPVDSCKTVSDEWNQVRADDVDDERLGHDGFHKPAGSELNLVSMQDKQQYPKSEVIKHRTNNAECNHKLADCLNVPSPRNVNHFFIHSVGCDCHFREIRHEISKQNLLGQ